MYGTVAKMQVKPGKLAELNELMSSDGMSKIPGLVSSTVYQMDADPNALYLAVVFTDKAAYVKNAESPEQNERYEQFVALLAGPPEWNDGEIVYPSK